MDWDVEMDDVANGFPSTDTDLNQGKQHVDSSAAVLSLPSNSNVDDATVVPNKVHVRGLDTLNTAELKSFVQQHFGAVERIEWIDDESANLVFHSETTAHDALLALSAVEIADATQLPPLECVPAKQVSSKPDINLQLRFAVLSDRKQAGAAARSRFYLLHPEYDPEERRRREQASRKKYRDREEDYRGPRQNGRGRIKTAAAEMDSFDASLYDDDEATLAERAAREARLQQSHSDIDEGDDADVSLVRRNRNKELFPSLQPRTARGAIRERSASPLRGNVGRRLQPVDRGFDTQGNRVKAHSIKDHLSASNGPKELFPSKLLDSSKSQFRQLGLGDVTTQPVDQVPSGSFASDAIEAEPVNPAYDESAHSISIRGIAQQRGVDVGFTIKGASGASVRELFPDRFGQTNTGKELFANKVEGRGRRRQRAEDLFYE